MFHRKTGGHGSNAVWPDATYMEDEVVAPTAAPTIVHRKRVLHDDIRVGSVVHE